jgi:hypothetical protein
MYRSVMANRGSALVEFTRRRTGGAKTSAQLVLHAQDIVGLYRRRACQLFARLGFKTDE